MIERDKFMSPGEAKAFGLIDTVLEHPPKFFQDESAGTSGNHNQRQANGQ